MAEFIRLEEYFDHTFRTIINPFATELFFLGLTEFKYGIFDHVLVILLSFSYYFR